MIPAAFDYHAPTSVAEAVQLLQQHGYDAKILAGGKVSSLQCVSGCPPRPY